MRSVSALMMCACLIVGCSTHRSTVKQQTIHSQKATVMADSTHRLTTEEMSQMISSSEQLHLVVYDTDKPVDSGTGKHPVKAEAWKEKTSSSHADAVRREDDTHTGTIVKQEQHDQSENQETDTMMRDTAGTLMWWWIAASLITIASGIMELRTKTNKL